MVEESTGELRGSGLTAAGRTHPGKVRKHNEDTFICDPEKGLFAVVDGMGGARAGEVAAGMTRDQLLAWPPEAEPFSGALHLANEEVHRQASENPDEEGMGCVVTAARLAGDELEIAHVGDTRAFLASGAGCEQLTRDHTLVADIQEAQGLVEAETERLPGRHQVTRDIGRTLHADASWVDLVETRFDVGDLLLLCSDGLSDLVTDSELFQLLGQARAEKSPIDAFVDDLIEMALTRGAHDNVTVVVVRRDKGSRQPAPRRPAQPKPPPPRDREVPTEKVPTLMYDKPGGSRWWDWLAKLGITLLLLAIGGTLGALWQARFGILPSPPAGPPEGRGAGAGSGLLDGSQGFGKSFSQDLEATVSGVWEVEGPAVTSLEPGVVLELRAPEISSVARESVWEIHLGPESRLTLRQASIHAPGLTLDVSFEGDDGILRIEDCHVELGKLVVSGSAGGLLEVEGGRLVVEDGIEAAPDGPRILGVEGVGEDDQAGEEDGEVDGGGAGEQEPEESS